MVKKLFENFWMCFGLMLLIAISDLIGLGTIDKLGRQWNVGLGFIIAFAYFVWFIIRFMTVKDEK
jgi:hypothetical protein